MSMFRRFSRDRRGIAAVEFAILSSAIMLPLFFGTVEVITLFRTEAKLTALTTDVALMVSYNATSINGITSLPVPASAGTPSLQDICQGAIQGLAPIPPGGMTMAIASVTLESNSAGLPATSAVHTTTPAYDFWEADFTVSGSTCSPVTGSTVIGATTAESLVTTSPPATGGPTGSSTAWNGMLAVPCDNAIIVRANTTYSGITGLVFKSRPVLSQTSYARWANTWNEAELQCSGTGCTTAYAATTPICTTTNTTATN